MDSKAHILLQEAESSYGMGVLASSYFGLYQLMSSCVKEVDHCEKLWECTVSVLVCQILFFIVYLLGEDGRAQGFQDHAKQ